ncbi:hypothetical protein MKY59_22775 [Paenibacillus sp. FSL W8-0426]|uniref:hypothetical protein n=1 Tax=Paenibacillus sp. FSL W8-0426 TaxID=2921714 RepID=UPI0030DC228C
MDDAMSENSIIKPIINKYAPLIKMAVEQRRYIDIGNYYRDYNQEIRDVNHCENELLAYLKSNLESSEWDRESLWFIAIYEHPSMEFIPYFIKILKSKLSKSVIYYHVLDVLSYMPDEISEMALPEVYLMVDEINPYWTREIIEKCF